MKRFLPLLIAVMLTPLAAAQHDEEALVAHGERKKAAYLVLRLITQEMELIPTESMDQCEVIGNEIINSGKLSKFLKGYRCVPGLIQTSRQRISNNIRRISRNNANQLGSTDVYINNPTLTISCGARK